uniref:Uncharacterized protein n=1 Tax=Utricularia reniformis TaxID=192314 RepID=A0A1Y0B2T8_9LAMI|nr:hypothetical protein AEK19_MT1580 [Utricularia reniformis]ART31765.1 hypothetical protein AEK19_MT1580 [Utricularia reniformis]
MLMGPLPVMNRILERECDTEKSFVFSLMLVVGLVGGVQANTMIQIKKTYPHDCTK